MRRRLDLGASLIGRPEVLFLDEPTTGLDPRSRAVMWDIIRDLATGGTTLLLTTQYLDEADRLASQIAVVDGGRMIAQGSPDELKDKAGRDRVSVTLAPAADTAAAVAAVSAHAAGPVAVGAGDRLTAQVPAYDGITTDLVRSLDLAGVRVTGIAVDRPSLDDVFLALTGHGVAEGAGQRQGDAGSDETGGQLADWDEGATPQGGEAA
jgi:ABC-2 type transport system ATP-binding protein